MGKTREWAPEDEGWRMLVSQLLWTGLWVGIVWRIGDWFRPNGCLSWDRVGYVLAVVVAGAVAVMVPAWRWQAVSMTATLIAVLLVAAVFQGYRR